MWLMNVVTTYLYVSLNNDNYMKIHEGYKMLETYNSTSQSKYSIKLQKILIRVKEFRTHVV